MDIAIVGMGCKFPGATSPDIFWQLLSEGRSAIADSPDRSSFHELPDYLCRGGYISYEENSLEKMGISPREARHMDPQQKLIIEVTQQALDLSHISISDLSRACTGVYIGVMGSDWGRLSLSDLNKIDIHTGTGNGHCMIANRISYLYNLRGPSIAIDTACSSSLVALDLAFKSLVSNEIDVALVGGVNSILTPALNVFYQKAGLASKDGKCKPFGSQADGIVRGEGAGLVILKRLSDAISEGNKIYGVIKATAVNHGGKSNGLTAPNKWAQIEVIRAALTRAKITPDQIQYVEAHGTGTSLGDPIEAQGLYEAVSQFRKKENALCIGSVKGNLGHLEGASGIASFIKVILSINNHQIPPSLHFGTGNDYIDFNKLNLKVVINSTLWMNLAKFAGISSFGLGGSNSHIIVSNYISHSTDKKFDPENNLVSLKKLMTLIAEVTEQSVSVINESSELIKQLGIDSLMTAELKEKMESQWQLIQPIEFGDLLQLRTVGDLNKYLQSRTKRTL